MRHLRVYLTAVLILCAARWSLGATQTVDFEDLGLPANSYENGANLSGQFVSHGATFINNYYGSYWSGWAYSSMTDTATAGFGNQYSAFTGSGDNSQTYAVGNPDYFSGLSIVLPTGYRPTSISVTNTTYTALAIRDGNDGNNPSFVRQFGTNEPAGGDYYLLEITGLDSNGQSVGTVPFYLADYRNINGAPNKLVDTWTAVDLSSLPASTVKLSFGLSSTDTGDFGINTPTYFAADNLVLTSVPEPSSIVLLSLTGLAACVFRNRRNVARYATAAVALCAAGVASAGPYASSGIPASSSSFVEWANSVQSLTRGPQDIANPSGAAASFGTSANALGPATNTVISLGDGGQITVGFAQPIYNGAGADFAVFENSFSSAGGVFAELGYVDVSSDGVNFFRFPSVSLTQTSTQANNASITDPTNIYNLAGKDLANVGTPFDLNELVGASPLLDVNNIIAVRVTDVVGRITAVGSYLPSLDSLGNIINDPYPTAFASGGFDFDAVGVINAVPEPATWVLTTAGLLVGVVVAMRRQFVDSRLI